MEKKRYPIDIPTIEQVSSEKKKIAHRNKFRKALTSTVYTLIVVAAVSVLIATLVFPVLQITGTSMEPTLNDKEIVVLMKTDKLETGDLCAFSYQNKILIKRIIGTPGDYIEIDKNGNVFVNGHKLDEPYVKESSLGQCDIEFPYQVPEKKFFVLGDHRLTSIDSRSSVIGCVEVDQIIGKVLFKIWPLNKISKVG